MSDQEPKKIAMTYEKLFEMLRAEKSKPGLQKISKDFFEQVSQYLHDKKQDIAKAKESDNMFASRQLDEDIKHYSNAKKIIKMLYDLREKKLVAMALNKSRTASSIIDTSGLHEKEISFFKDMVEQFDLYRKRILDAMMSDPTTSTQMESKSGTSTTQLVRFLDHVESMDDEKGGKVGPFLEEDVANIPSAVAEALLEQGKVQYLNMQ